MKLVVMIGPEECSGEFREYGGVEGVVEGLDATGKKYGESEVEGGGFWF